MPQPVLALGAALVTASGCVWYVPALADLRAGLDRPASRRSAAAACLSGWATTGVIAVLLLVVEAWWPPCAAAMAGGTVVAALRIRAGRQRRWEAREIARHWAALRHAPPVHAVGGNRSRNVFAALTGAGLVGAAVISTLLVAAGPDDGADWLVAAAAPAAVLGLFLALAVTHTHMARRRTREDDAWPLR